MDGDSNTGVSQHCSTTIRAYHETICIGVGEIPYVGLLRFIKNKNKKIILEIREIDFTKEFENCKWVPAL